MESSPTMNDRLRQAGEHYEQRVGDELIVLKVHELGGRYFGMNTTGARIWDIIRETPRIVDLCDRMAAEYILDRPSLEKEILAFVRLLENRGLICVERAAT